MTLSDKNYRLEKLAEQNADHSWADFGSSGPVNPLLSRYIAAYTYSIGCLREQDAKLITRAYPTVMTQIYFEFCGGLSEIRGRNHGFGRAAVLGNAPDSIEAQTNPGIVIEKRVYIKQGLGGWFDIYQLASQTASRPIKNFKVDLYPMALYELFQHAPGELANEDLQLADLLGHAIASLMLEEMEAANSGQALIGIVERYFLQQLWQQVNRRRLELTPPSTRGAASAISPKGFTPPLPNIQETLSQQARHHHKSERWLQKRYAEVYGMSFKQIQGSLRFQQAHRELWQALAVRRPVSLTELAYHNGYFDQAHFIKDFKRHTGMTPGQYLKTNFDAQSQYLWYW